MLSCQTKYKRLREDKIDNNNNLNVLSNKGIHLIDLSACSKRSVDIKIIVKVKSILI